MYITGYTVRVVDDILYRRERNKRMLYMYTQKLDSFLFLSNDVSLYHFFLLYHKAK